MNACPRCTATDTIILADETRSSTHYCFTCRRSFEHAHAAVETKASGVSPYVLHIGQHAAHPG